jgi:hypothetical protein
VEADLRAAPIAQMTARTLGPPPQGPQLHRGLSTTGLSQQQYPERFSGLAIAGGWADGEREQREVRRRDLDLAGRGPSGVTPHPPAPRIQVIPMRDRRGQPRVAALPSSTPTAVHSASGATARALRPRPAPAISEKLDPGGEAIAAPPCIFH